MKTKQLLAVLTAALLVLGLFSACTAKKNENETQTGLVLPTPEQRPGDGPLCEIRLSMHSFPPKQRAGQENGRLSPQSYPARHFL